MEDLVADQTRSGHHSRHKAGGNADADDGLASLGYRMLDEPHKTRSVTSPGHGSDVGRSRGDTGLGAETRGGDDEARRLPLQAHIPTRTVLALAALRLR